LSGGASVSGGTAALCAGVVFLGFLASPAPAQDRTIEEIVVTAQKREEVLQEVPISIAAFTGEFMKESGIAGIHELVRHAPGVFYANESPCCAPVFIRGFGSPFVGSSFDPTVSFVLDELSIPKDIYLADPLYDIERFEVLRGPQGILFGKNTPAGLFNVTTGRPSRELSGYLLGRIGDLGVHRVEAAVGGPLGPFGERAQFRLAVLDAALPEDVRNTKRGEKEPATEHRAGRLRLAFQPLDELEIFLTGSRSNIEAARTFSFQQKDLSQSSIDFLRQFDPEFEDDGFDHRNSQDFPANIERTTDLLSAHVRHSLGSFGPVRDVELVAVVGATGFEMDAPVDNDFSPADIIHLEPAFFEYDQHSAEFRASALFPAPFLGEIEILGGFLWFESSFRNDFRLAAGEDFEEWLLSPAGFEIGTGQAPPGGLGFPSLPVLFGTLGLDPSTTPSIVAGDGFDLVSDQETSAYGIFGEAAWRLTEQWTFRFGARANFERKSADLDFDCLDPGVACLALGASDFSLDLRRRESDFSPKFTIQYFPYENLSLFATRAKGFKSGGYNNLLTTDVGVEVEPEETVSWETGAKGKLFSNALSYGATFFNMDVENLQVQQFLGTTTVVVRNAGGARSRGVELDFQWLTPWEPLSLRAAGAFTDARYKDFANAPAPRSFASNEQDLSGKRMPFVSKWQLNVTPELRFPLDLRSAPVIGEWLPPDLALAIALDVFYRSDHYLDIDLDPATLQDGYVLLNGRVRLLALDEALSFGLTVDNVTDVEALQFATDSATFPGYMVVQEFQRVVAFDLRYSW
jgi:iron complex outermembrane recepter protein